MKKVQFYREIMVETKIKRNERFVSKVRTQSEFDPAKGGNVQNRIQDRINKDKKYNIKYRGWFGERQHQILVLEGKFVTNLPKTT